MSVSWTSKFVTMVLQENELRSDVTFAVQTFWTLPHVVSCAGLKMYVWLSFVHVYAWPECLKWSHTSMNEVMRTRERRSPANTTLTTQRPGTAMCRYDPCRQSSIESRTLTQSKVSFLFMSKTKIKPSTNTPQDGSQYNRHQERYLRIDGIGEWPASYCAWANEIA